MLQPVELSLFFRKLVVVFVFLLGSIYAFCQPEGAHTYFQTDFLFALRDQQGRVWGQDHEGHAFISDGTTTQNLDDKIPFCSLITAIFEDSEGMIWIGNCELVRYNPRLDKFDLLGNQIIESTGTSPQKFNSFFEDSKGNIWIAAVGGLFRFSKINRTFSQFSKLRDVTIALEAPDGKIWFDAVTDTNKTSTLHSLDPVSGKIEEKLKLSDIPLKNTNPEWWSERKVLQLGGSSSPDFLILTDARCFRLNTEHISISKIPSPSDRPNDIFYSIITHNDMILAGVPRNRVLRFLPNENRFVPYWTPPITGVNFNRLFHVDTDTWWAISYLFGYINHDVKSPFIIEYFPEFMWNEGEGYFDRQLLFQGKVYLHAMDSLLPMHPQQKNLPAIRLEMPIPNFLDYKFTYREDPEKPWLWMLMRSISSDSGKMLCAFDNSGKLVKKYPLPPLTGAFTKMVFDKNRNLWIGTNQNGVLKFDMKRETLVTHPIREMEFAGSELCEVVMVDKDNNLWFSSASQGVRRYHLDTGKLDIFRHDPNNVNSLSGDRVTAIYEDSKGRFWFGTHFGITRWEPSENRFRRYSIGDGLLQTSVRAIVEDKNGDIWVATVQHLNKYLPNDDRFLPFGRNDGQDCSFFKQYGFCDEKGNLFFEEAGGGAWIGHPDEIKNYRSDIPSLFLSGFLVSNQPAHPGGKDGILQQAINFTDKIELAYRQNSFTFQYTALEFIQKPNYVEYAYQLEGFDKDWQQVGKKREAAYTGLSPGHYVFKVKCRNHQGFWGELREISITILPPWYRTWWAYLLWAAILAGSLYWLYRFQLNRRLAEAEALRLKELDLAKSRLYTNITHEFRTPLTVILGMAEQVKSDPKKWFNEGLQLIRRNGKQLLSLVNQLLDLSKLESGDMPLKLVQGDVVNYLKYLTESFHSYAESRDIRLHFLTDLQECRMDYDPEKLGNVVSNLLSNAIKFTPEAGDIYLQIGMRDEGRGMMGSAISSLIPHSSSLELVVRDTGIGIPPAAIPHIFDRFYQVDDSSTRRGEGTGIGLALAKELVTLMGGSITVESKVGAGTKFTVQLPITRLAPEIPPDPLKGEPQKQHPAEIFEEITSELPDYGSPFRGSGGVEKPLVLLIEDHRDVLTYLTSFLSGEYQIVLAKDGQEGWDKALELIPDLIVSDVMMPKKDGFEVCESVKTDERTCHIPVILLTAKAGEKAKIEGLAHGADAYIAKPFNREELMVRIEKLIDGRRRIQEQYAAKGFLRKSASLKPQSLDDIFLQKITGIVEENLSDENFGLPELCRQAAMSRSQLFRKLKALTGQSTNYFIRNVRLEKAKELLETTHLSISEIAYQTGFVNPAYFSRVFKEVFGVPPGEVRR
jgi:signal transduction histidine kinase/DNA-binding response OmpR family regulator/streptogramin lyase